MGVYMTDTDTNCCHTAQHPDHSKECARLNRVAGQIEGIKKMIEERRYCPDILTQLRAVRSAVNAIEANILESHFNACVSGVFAAGNEAEQQQKIAELKELYRRFNH